MQNCSLLNDVSLFSRSDGICNDAHPLSVRIRFFRPNSQDTLKTIACGSGGIFQAIPDGGALSTAMSFYYRFVGESIRSIRGILLS